MQNMNVSVYLAYTGSLQAHVRSFGKTQDPGEVGLKAFA